MANNYRPIRAKRNEVTKVSQSSGANGSILRMDIECGNCGFGFSRSYSLAQLAEGYPHEECPECKTWNFIPYSLSGRNGGL